MNFLLFIGTHAMGRMVETQGWESSHPLLFPSATISPRIEGTVSPDMICEKIF